MQKKKVIGLTAMIVALATGVAFGYTAVRNLIENLSSNYESANSNGSSIVINDSATVTDSKKVTLNLSSNSSKMLISNSEYYINKVYQIKRGNTFVTIPPQFLIAELDSEGKVIGFKKFLEWENITENDINNGLVIVDTKGNEFVWIPVDEVTSGTTVDSTLYTNKVVFSRYGWNDNSSGTVSNSTENGNYYEPATETVVVNGVIKNEFEELKTSIDDYGGFYVGRYEASFGGFKGDKPVNVQVVPSTKYSTSGTLEKTKENEGQLWNNLTLSGARYYAQELYSNNKYVSSHLPYGAEYDTVLKWFIKTGSRTLSEIESDSTSWGNYSGIKNTGSNSNYQTNHIYDIAGNLSEYTQELGRTILSSKTVIERGGSYQTTVPVSYREGNWEAIQDPEFISTSPNRGFRVFFNIKNNQEIVTKDTVWDSFTPTIEWELEEDTGKQKVYAWFNGDSGIESEVIEAEIEVVSEESFTIQSDNGYTVSDDVTLELYSNKAQAIVISNTQETINKTISITRGSTTVVIPPTFAIAELGSNGEVIGKKPLKEWKNITESDINAGLVVVDSDNNEFVWIPVDSVLSGLTSTNQIFEEESATINSVVLSRVNWSAEKGGFKTGYTLTTTPGTASTNPQPYDDPDGFDTMLDSVRTYKGFYIGRYEATPGGSNSEITTKRGLTPQTGLKRKEFLTATENLYKDDSYISSHEMYSTEFDTILKWLIKTGAITLDEVNTQTFGNSGTSSATVATGTEYKHTTTGKSNILNHIYDLEGNVWERTKTLGRYKASILSNYDVYYARGNCYEDTYALGSYASYTGIAGVHDSSYTKNNLGTRVAVNIRSSVGTPTSIDDLEVYVTEKSWTLTEGYGEKTVYAYYIDTDRNITELTSTVNYVTAYMKMVPDTILLDKSVKTEQSLFVEGIGYGNITFTSTNPSVATVSEDGRITALSNGSTTITATEDSGNNLSAKCEVVVQTSPTAITASENIKKVMSTEEKMQLEVNYTPSDTNVNKECKYITSDSSIATVDANGVIIANGQKSGTVTITIETKNGKETTVDIRVERPILMEREDDVYVIGAKRAGKTEYTSETIKTITLLDTNVTPVDVVDSWDVSYNNGDGIVKAWIKNSLEAGKYDLYIGGYSKIIAPANAAKLFSNYTFCTSISNIEVLDLEEATDMSEFFANCFSMTEFDLRNINTQNVTNIDKMFKGNSKLKTIIFGKQIKDLNGSEIFANCDKLERIIIQKTATTVSDVLTLSNNTKINTTAKIYLPNDETKTLYTNSSNYASEFGENRIKTILDVLGVKTINVTPNSTYDESVDRGTLVAGINKANATDYTKYGYTVTTIGLPVDTTTTGTKQVKYTLKYADSSEAETTVMEVTREIKVNEITATLMEREGSENDSGMWNSYYAIGAKRSGNTKYTADVISTITFVNNTNIPTTAEASWDASYTNGDNKVIAWVVPNEKNSTSYDLYIGTEEDKIQAPANSYNLFGEYTSCTSINSLEMLDTTNVTDMSYMFCYCNGLTNLDVSSFDTTNVTNMASMFSSCSNLISLNLSRFNTTNVTSMSDMFSYCSNLTSLDLSNLDTAKVTNMASMFSSCSNLTSLNLKAFNTTNVTSMSDMFSYCSNLTSLDLSGFDTSKVTDMNYMFQLCSSLTNLDLSNFNTTSVTNMSCMFDECNSLKSLDLSNFNTNNVTDMGYIFSNCSSLKAIILNKEITDSDYALVLQTDTGLENLPNAILYVSDTASEKLYEAATNYATIFADSRDTEGDLYRVRPILEVAGENPAKVSLNGIYDETKDAGVTIAGFDKANASEYTQYGYNYTTSGLPVDTTSIGIKQVTYTLTKTKDGITTNGMTATRDVKVVGVPILTERESRDYINGKLIYYAIGAKRSGNTKYTADLISTITFVNNANIPSTAEASWDASYTSGDGEVIAWVVPNSTDSTKYDLYIGANDTTIQAPAYSYNLFGNYTSCTTINNLMMLDTSNVTNMYNMFSYCSKLTSLDVSNFDTSKVTDMGYMFSPCSSLTELDVSKFDTSKVTNMWHMFSYCSSLTELDLSKFDTSKVTSMGDMFSYCTRLTELDVSNFNTTNVTNMDRMFYYCSKLTSLDLSNFNTTSVTNMDSMFSYCSSLTKLDVSNFDTSKVTDMWQMFSSCSSLTELDVSKFDTSKVTNMYGMFYSCRSLTELDVSNFNTTSVTYMGDMFYSCRKLTSLDVSNFNTTSVTYMGDMFSNCSSLIELDVSNFNTTNVTNMDRMFFNCSKLTSLDVSNFNTTSVTYMGNMFFNCSSLTKLDVSNFDTSKVTDMSGMFGSCRSLTELDVSKFDTSKVTNMSYMFSNCSSLTKLDLSKFDTSKVTNMKQMFYYCSKLKAIILDKEITSSDQAMKLLTGSSSINTGLEDLPNAILYVPDTASEKLYEAATNYATIFADSRDTEDDLYRVRPILEVAGENPVKVKVGETYDATVDAGVTIAGFGVADSGEYTQYGYNYTTSGLPVDTTTKGIKQVTYTLTKTKDGITTNGMTATRDVKVVGVPTLMKRENSDYINGKLIYYAIGAKRSGNTKYTADLISTITFVENTDVPANAEASWDASYTSGDGEVIAWAVPNSTDSTKYDLYIGANDTTIQAPADSYSLFGNYTSCISINNLMMLDTSKVTNMWNMFSYCRSLTSLNISNFNTTSVTNMYAMFYSCSKLTSLDVSNFNTTSVTNMGNMFESCSSLTELDVSNFNTTSVTSMSEMFRDCRKLTSLDVSNFDTSKVTNMFDMFYYCSSLTELDVSNFNTTSVTSMIQMFSYCSSLTELDVSKFDTSKVTNMYSMFYSCSKLTSLDVSNFDTSKVTNMYRMFYSCSKLKAIILDKEITSSDQAMKLLTGSSSINTGLEDLPNAILYVPDTASEKLYEAAANYSTIFADSRDTEGDLYRVRPILEVAGENPVKVKVGETYDATVDAGVTIAGFGVADSGEYTQYGYNYTTSGLPVDTTSVGTKQVTYTLTKTKDGTTTNGMTATRDVEVVAADITGSVSISGDCMYGETLIVDTSKILPENVNLEYKWYINDTDSTTGGTLVKEANSDSGLENRYFISGDTIGKYIYVEVIASLENYTTKTFADVVGPVQRADINRVDAFLVDDIFAYDENPKEPGVYVVDLRGPGDLTLGEDYTLEYKDNVNVGTGKVIVKGINKYTGELELTFKIIKAPEFELVNLTPEWTTSKVSIAINILDVGAGIEKVLFEDKEVTLQNNTATVSVDKNGLYVAEVFDIYGNSVVKELYVGNIDREVPVIEEVKYDGVTFTKEVKVEVKVTDTGSGVYAYAVSEKDAEPTTWTQITPVENMTIFNFTISSNGTYYLFVKDTVGNITKYDKQIVITNIDNAPPVIKLFNIIDDYTFTTEVFIEINAEDDTGVEDLLLSNEMLTNSQVEDSDNWVPYTETVLYSLPSKDGNHTVYAWVRDSVGKISEYAQDNTLLLNKYVGNNGINSVSFKFLVKDENYNFAKKITESNIKIFVKDDSDKVTYSTEYGVNVTSISLPVVYGPAQEGTEMMTGEYYTITVENIGGEGTVYLVCDENSVVDKAGNKITDAEIKTDVEVELNTPKITLGTTEIQVSDSDGNLIQAIKINGKTVLLTGGKITYEKLKTEYGITLKTDDTIEAFDKHSNSVMVTVQ